MPKAQVGRTIHKMRAAHAVLRIGDLEKGLPHFTNDHLQMIFEDPMVGLDTALNTFLVKASTLYKAIVRAAVAMAKAMSMKIIAEGVETNTQKDFLIHEGCDLLQGYLFARPMPVDDFVQYLQMNTMQPSSELSEAMVMNL